MSAYYNENDPFAAQWLRNLIAQDHIAPGVVDERSIEAVKPADLAGFTQCHFFAGIGGWSHALRFAGWSDHEPVWTGSCPCQRFSSAARGRQVAADLWPAFRGLIDAAAPRVVFGEQVATARDWFDGVCADVEAMGYEVGAAVLPAVAVGADHSRERLYFACHSNRNRKPSGQVHAKAPRMQKRHGQPRGMVPQDGIPPRVAQLRAFGNAIVPGVAVEFIKAFRDGNILTWRA